VIERFFMAADTDNEFGAQYGPFSTAEEAEREMCRLGWKWLLVYTHRLDCAGQIMEVTSRFFQPDVREKRTPGDVEHLRRMLVTDVPPLTNDDIKFFSQYEEQMEGFKV
jgi:hypothetical protein